MMEKVFKILPPEIVDYIQNNPRQGLITFLLYVVFAIIYVILMIVAVIVLQRVNRKFFKYLEKKRGKKTHLQFLQRVINALIVVGILIVPLAGESIGKSILGSAAVITAVVGFAAQDVIKDMIGGFLISVYKPFDIGDRIELEDGTVGIVESLTMRHVVIIRIDTLRVVIPNSKINQVSVVNYSFGYVERSNLFKFSVGYDSDISEVKKVIYEAVEGSPYSLPGKKLKDGSSVYGPVYFLEIADSALIMAVTVYYKPTDPTEVVKDDINTRVFEALDKYGIEIPYPYTTVLMKNE